MKNKTNATHGGVGFTGLLQLIFIVLKLCKTITWNWFWVLSPAWISCALVVAAIVIAILAACANGN